MREGKEKGVKETAGFMRAQEENLAEIFEENRNISWSSDTEKIKEANSLNNMGVTSRTETIVNYQEGQNKTKKNHKINNVTPQTDNTIIVYNEITKEVHVDKPERAKPNSSSNHNTDESNIHLANLKQEIEIKHTEQEASKAEIMKGVVENGETIEELEGKSCEKGKTETKVEIIEVKQPVEKNTTQKEYQNIGELIVQVPVEIANIQTKTKQEDNDIVAKKTSNLHQQKEAAGNRQRKEIGEEPKYSDSEQQGKDNKTYNFRSTSTSAKIETKKMGEEDNTHMKHTTSVKKTRNRSDKK